MFKKAAAVSLLALTCSAQAWADCRVLEAQVIAKVTSVSMMDEATCSIDLDFTAKGSMYNEHGLCPLGIDEVLGKSITLVKNVYQFSCPYEVGDQFSGYLYKDATGQDDTVYTDY